VATVAAAAYLAVVWPTIDHLESANTLIRVVVLIGAAIGVGILAQVEESERLAVARLSGDIQAREQYIRSVIESLGEGLITLDLEGRVTGWNRAVAERYGISAAEVIGESFLDRFPNYAQEGLAVPLRKLLGGEIEDFTVEGLTHETLRKGDVVQNLRGTLLRQDGRPAGAVLLVQDITERVALERSARQGEKLVALGTLAAGVAHEINDPLAFVSSNLNRVEEIWSDPGERRDVPEILAECHEGLARLRGTVAELLRYVFTRSDFPPPPSAVHLGAGQERD